MGQKLTGRSQSYKPTQDMTLGVGLGVGKPWVRSLWRDTATKWRFVESQALLFQEVTSLSWSPYGMLNISQRA